MYLKLNLSQSDRESVDINQSFILGAGQGFACWKCHPEPAPKRIILVLVLSEAEGGDKYGLDAPGCCWNPWSS